MILKLTLKKKWFDMVASGVKIEEYREIKPYWTQRLMRCYAKGFTKVEFTNGYGKHRPRITLECKSIDTGIGNPAWGAENDKEYFVIKLGQELSRDNF